MGDIFSITMFLNIFQIKNFEEDKCSFLSSAQHKFYFS